MTVALVVREVGVVEVELNSGVGSMLNFSFFVSVSVAAGIELVVDDVPCVVVEGGVVSKLLVLASTASGLLVVSAGVGGAISVSMMEIVVVGVVGGVVGAFISVVVAGCELVRLKSVGWGGVASCSQACIFIGVVIELGVCIFVCFCVWG